MRSGFTLDFAKDIEIDLAVEGGVEGIIKCFLQTFQGETQVTIILNCFNSRKFTSTNPIHQLPKTMTFASNFLNQCVEERSLSVLNNLLEILPIIKTS